MDNMLKARDLLRLPSIWIARAGRLIGFRPLARFCAFTLLLTFLTLLATENRAGRAASTTTAQVLPVLPGICSDSDRFGVAAPGPRILWYDVGQLHAGWYLNFTVQPDAPRTADMTFVQMIRLSQGAGDDTRPCAACADRVCCPTWSELQYMAQRNPGALWLVGNEPDSMSGGQDNLTPARYAELYKAYHDWLKDTDPTCLVGFGGVVQPTPIRLAYLDLVLEAYDSQNPDAPFLPADVWSAHNYILREKRYRPGCGDCWGAGVPPGMDEVQAGILYEIEDHLMIEPNPSDPTKIGWKQQIVELRLFMKEHGYRDRPLILSEYGNLMPAGYGNDQFHWADIQEFLVATAGWLLNTTDGEIGDPSDGDRLVQAWAWWPFDLSEYGGVPGEAHLFHPRSHTLTPVGQQYRAYTKYLTTPFPGSVDLRALSIQHGQPIVGDEGVTLAPILVTIGNAGDEGTSSGPFTVQILRGGVPKNVVGVPEGLHGQETMAIEVTWPVQIGEWIDASVVITDTHTVDCDPYNQSTTARLWIGDNAFYLPLVDWTD